jgi:dihydrolipoamide dehydrogenase
MKTYEAIVIGAGPGGYEAALELGRLGVRTLLVDRAKTRFGGTCLNEGCIPAKLYLEAAFYASRSAYFRECGVVTETTGLELNKLRQRTADLIEEIRTGVLWMLERLNVELLYGEARFVDAHTLDVSGERVGFERAIIATGSAFRGIPNIALDGQRIISSREAFELVTLPSSLAIVGSGPIGCEFASFFAAFGTKVTLIGRRPMLLPSEDEEAAKALLRAFKKRGIEVLTSTSAKGAEATSEGVTLTLEGEGAQQLRCDVLLCASGRTPYTAGLAPENAGVTLDERGFVRVDANFVTSREHIYAVGDCIPTPAFAHTATAEGRIAARNLNGAKEDNPHLTPSITFSHPPLASCGLSEEQARAQGLDIEVRKAYFKANSRAKIRGDDAGFAKVVVDAKNKSVLGATVVGAEAPEIIHELLLAVEERVSVDALREMIHGHPTVSEIMRYL